MSEPYKFKLRTPKRGQAWESVAQQLNSIHQPIFRVTTRSVHDRFSLLSTKYAHKLRMEEKASGIEVEQSEVEKLIEEILEQEKTPKTNWSQKNVKRRERRRRKRLQEKKSRNKRWREWPNEEVMMRKTEKRNRRSDEALLTL